MKPRPPSTPYLPQVQHARSHGELRRAHKLKAYKREVHLIKVKYCQDTRPGHQLEASSKQHETRCRQLKAKKVTLHAIFLGEGGSIYTSNTLHHLKELGLASIDLQWVYKTALELHARSVHYTHKLTTTRRALEQTKSSQGLGLE